LFHAKTRRREEAALAAKRLFIPTARPAAPLKEKGTCRSQAIFFASSRLRVKPTGAALANKRRAWMLEHVQHDEGRERCFLSISKEKAPATDKVAGAGKA
jgi:hypothetical protein